MRTSWLRFLCLLHFPLVGCGSGDSDVSSTSAYGGAGGLGPATGGVPSSGGLAPASGGAPGGSSSGGAGGSSVGGAGGGAQPAGGGTPAATGGAGGSLQGQGGAPGTGGVSAGGTGGGNSGGSPSGTGGAGGTASQGTPCITDPATEGAILGDSYVTGFGSPALQPALTTLDASIGKYPNYAGAGCSMVSGGTCTGLYGNVPQQANTALTQHPKVKFMIVDGGGNDVLICDILKYPNCNTLCNKAGSSKQKVCTDIVTDAIKGAQDVFMKMGSSGVRDIVYFFYPHIPSASGGYNEILDYAAPLVKTSCDGAAALTGGKLRCHFIDLVEPFRAKFGDAAPSQFEALGIHPLQPGVDVLAKLIVDTMKTNCLGQANGCCSATP